jgi:hypothetical protein
MRRGISDLYLIAAHRNEELQTAMSRLGVLRLLPRLAIL